MRGSPNNNGVNCIIAYVLRCDAACKYYFEQLFICIQRTKYDNREICPSVPTCAHIELTYVGKCHATCDFRCDTKISCFYIANLSNGKMCHYATLSSLLLFSTLSCVAATSVSIRTREAGTAEQQIFPVFNSELKLNNSVASSDTQIHGLNKVSEQKSLLQ